MLKCIAASCVYNLMLLYGSMHLLRISYMFVFEGCGSDLICVLNGIHMHVPVHVHCACTCTCMCTNGGGRLKPPFNIPAISMIPVGKSILILCLCEHTINSLVCSLFLRHDTPLTYLYM